MQFKNILLFSALALSFAAHAATDAASAVPAATAPAAAATAGKVPRLNIHWDCGDCVQNEKVPPLLEQGYADAAKENNQTVATDDVADVSIVDIRQRSPGVRVMFGIMAGKDRLGIKIKYKGKEFEAHDSSANSMQGMNKLCGSVAQQAYKQLAEAAKQ